MKLGKRTENFYDVVIIGAGLAGLSLARQLLLYSNKTVLLLDRRAEIPPQRQKVGEATVQLSAYYFSKVLDLEEHLLREHFMKYNLRFYWKSAERDNSCYEDYSQSYIRNFSNIASYQLDRNKIEGEMLRLNLEFERFAFLSCVSDLKIEIKEDEAHSITFKTNENKFEIKSGWVVDASGRNKVLAKSMNLKRENTIRHGSSFFWVEGLLNIEKLTSLSLNEIRLRKDRTALGHLPVWLATNHFMGEGFWFWVIPLQGKTSLGLVYDTDIIEHEQVNTPEKLIEWICREFPLFKRDLPQRKILDHSSLKSFSYDCEQTISPERWAMSGEAGRFTDPLYSPGGDLISLYNTLITDAILTEDENELKTKCKLYEQLMRSFYEAYVPSYAVSYNVLGDQEAMTLKYSWELAIYFSFYVFPFINDLFTDERFVISFVRKFAQLGPINKYLQSFLSDYFQWKKTNTAPTREPRFYDIMEIEPLRRAEKTFYRVGVSVEEARKILDEQLANLKEFARFIFAQTSANALDDESLLTNRAFIESIDLNSFSFDLTELRERAEAYADEKEIYEWSFNPHTLKCFKAESRSKFNLSLVEGGAVCTTMHL
jgi:flavin-dependent dehydrogenase